MPYWPDAACLGKTWMTMPGNVEAAREVCLGCPASEPCTDYALTPQAAGIPGVLAGLTPDQRAFIECECDRVVPKPKTRNGLCWRCYQRQLEAA